MANPFKKQPTEVVDYFVDMEEYFAPLDTDEVKTIVVTKDITTTPDLAFGPGAFPETVLVGTPPLGFKLWVGGGLDGSKYKITMVVTTLVGRVEEFEFYIKVKDT